MVQTPTDPAKAQVWVTGTGTNLEFEFYFPRGNKGDPGGITNTVVPNNTDLDLYQTPGAYSVTSGIDAAASALAHLPFHESGALMVLYSQTGAIQIQTYTTNTKNVYVRRRFSGAWSAWRSFASSRVDQTAGRAIYTWDEINSREQLTYGDTGLRQLLLADLSVYGATGTPDMRLRRVGHTVDLDIVGLTASTAGTVTFPGLIPLGFRPTHDRRVLNFSEVSGLQKLTYIKANGDIQVQSFSDTADKCRLWLTYTTTNTWPAVLPGVASGSIPAT